MSNMQNLAQKVWEAGFAVLNGYQPSKSAAEVVPTLGEIDTHVAIEPLHELKPAPAEVSLANTYSGSYGLGAFPLHTDMAHWHVPPHFLMLRCLQGSTAVPTILADGLPIVEQVGKAVLARALVKPRHTVRGKRTLLRVYERLPTGGYILRWDENFVLPASPAGERGMGLLRTALATAPRRNVYLAQPGDTLVLDNWRMLHGRGSVPPDALNRNIARAYLRSVG